MTPVHVGELNTSVTGDAGSASEPAAASGQPPWEELERIRRAEAELARLRARTRAEGFDA